MSTQYTAARNCDYNDLPDWYESIRTALTNAGLSLNENYYSDILHVLDGEFGFYPDNKEIREDVLDKLSRIVKEHLGETEYRRILNSDCNFLVSDPTDLNARSNLPGARVHGEKETITGNKVEDLIIYMIYPFLNPYEPGLLDGTGGLTEPQSPPVNPAASETPASPSEPFHFGPPASPSEPFHFGNPPSSPGPSWDELFPPVSGAPPPADRQFSFGPPGSFDSDDEGMNRSGGKRRKKKSRRKRKSKKKRKSRKRRKSRKKRKSKKKRKSRKKRKR